MDILSDVLLTLVQENNKLKLRVPIACTVEYKGFKAICIA